MKKLLGKLMDLMTNPQRPTDTKVVVEPTVSLANSLQPGESIL